MRKSDNDRWYKYKGYLHFDFVRSKEVIYPYVSDPLKVAKHAFSPFIHYIKKSRRYRRDKVSGKLRETAGNALHLNSDKTEERIYKPEERTQNIQYLGFVFDGKKIYIRNSSISKNRMQISETVRKNKKGNKKVNTRAVYKAQSGLIMTPFDEKRRGFINYAIRSGEVMEESGIDKQIAKNDAFIKSKIAEERPKSRKKRI